MSNPIHAALGSLALLGEQSVKQNSPKLADFSGLDDATALALTYCFDHQIRLTRLFQVLEAHVPEGSPDLARAVQASYDSISAGATWQARAAEAHRILLELETEVGPRAIAARDQLAAHP